MRPDRLGFEPRIGISWRPIPASTIVVRAGYGIYHDTSVYQTSALATRAAGAALEKLERAEQRLLPADAGEWIHSCSSITPNTFAIDPELPRRLRADVAIFRAARSARRGATQCNLSRRKGTHGAQQFLPNTYPIGAANPCAQLSVGFRVSDFGRQLHAPVGPVAVAAQAAQRIYGIAALHLFEIDRR